MLQWCNTQCVPLFIIQTYMIFIQYCSIWIVRFSIVFCHLFPISNLFWLIFWTSLSLYEFKWYSNVFNRELIDCTEKSVSYFAGGIIANLAYGWDPVYHLQVTSQEELLKKLVSSRSLSKFSLFWKNSQQQSSWSTCYLTIFNFWYLISDM